MLSMGACAALLGTAAKMGGAGLPWTRVTLQGPPALNPVAVSPDAAALVALPPQGKAGPPGAAGTQGARGDAESTQAAPGRALRVRSNSVTGKAVDLDGQPVTGAGVRLPQGARELGRTDANGLFAIQIQRGGQQLALSPSSGFVALASTRVGSAGEAQIIAHPARPAFQLLLTDRATGLPLGAAKVDLSLPASGAFQGRLASARARHPGLQPVEVSVRSDSAGFARMEWAPDLPGCRLRLSRPGYEPSEVALPDGEALASGLTLRAALVPAHGESAERRMLQGRVLGPDGAAVSGAEVRASTGAAARSRADGTFELALPRNLAVSPVVHAFHPSRGQDAQPVAAFGETVLHLQQTSLPQRPLTSRGGELLPGVRIVPVDPAGRPDPLAPHWRCAQTSADGGVRLPADPATTELWALSKDGERLGQVVQAPSGEGWILR